MENHFYILRHGLMDQSARNSYVFPWHRRVVPRCSAAVIFTFPPAPFPDEKELPSLFCRFHLYLSAFAVLLSIQYSGACESADQGI